MAIFYPRQFALPDFPSVIYYSGARRVPKNAIGHGPKTLNDRLSTRQLSTTIPRTNVHIVFVSDLSSIIHDHPPRVNVESVYISSDSTWKSSYPRLLRIIANLIFLYFIIPICIQRVCYDDIERCKNFIFIRKRYDIWLDIYIRYIYILIVL